MTPLRYLLCTNSEKTDVDDEEAVHLMRMCAEASESRSCMSFTILTERSIVSMVRPSVARI
jgi:hypothetical protein